MDVLRGLYIADTEVDELLARPLATGWGQGVELETEQAEVLAVTQAWAAQRVQSAQQAARLPGRVL